ncbi:hypothetical protein QAD02_024046 [Eretmocerus hayati]|uniref:Uncharacterized protein n=1 Tax=Eretmocerus hayati TaxID=131215 RepID=A0ACC2PXI6_9HYME|nr:hypothetical protein QAD02_024046 [Eretmocerus hayati]
MRQRNREYFFNIKHIFDNFTIVSVDVVDNEAPVMDELEETFNVHTPMDVNTFERILKTNENVMEQILQVCKENNLTEAKSRIFRNNFFHSPQHNGLFCWIKRSASTSFAKLFSDINGQTRTHNDDNDFSFLFPKTNVSLDYLMKDSRTFKFLAVRHPFERLVSAYRDRIEDNSNFKSQAWVYVPKIFHLTRPDLFKPSGVLEETLGKIFYQNRRLKLVPTFEEFIRWLLQEDPTQYDSHWDRYYQHCSLCHVRYNQVLKLDNYTTDELDFTFYHLNLGRHHSLRIHQLQETKGGQTNFEQTCNYFKNLSHASIVSLYEKYRIDFDMLNYDFDRYFECIEGD